MRIAMKAAGDPAAAQQTAVAAFEFGIHVEQPFAAQQGSQHAKPGVVDSTDDMEL